ncbi:glucosyltransferase domain-containing protein [Patescibacteria group bacterium]|nr:glucosyltransferase domain-containing protein [Patescibacteria group bacterium]
MIFSKTIEEVKKIISALSLSKKDIPLLVVGFMASFLSRGVLLFSLGYNTDDFSMMLGPTRNGYLLVSYGRWGIAIVHKGLAMLGVEANYGTPFLVFFSFIALAYCGVLLCKMWGIQDKLVLSSVVILLFIVHPYQSGIYTYSLAIVTVGLALLFTFVPLYVLTIRKSKIIIGLSAILFCFALSIYQITINYALVVVLVLVLLTFLRTVKKGQKTISALKYAFKKSSVHFFVLILGTALYGCISWIIIKVLAILPYSRSQILSFSPEELFKRATQIANLFYEILFVHEAINPGTLKYIALFVLMGSIVAVAVNSCRGKVTSFVVYLALLVSVFLSVIGISLALKIWFFEPRLYAAIGLAWAAVVVSGYLSFRSVFARKVFIALSVVVIIGFISIDNHIFIDRIRMNSFDRALSNRIVAALEQNPNSDKVERIVILGEYEHQQPVQSSFALDSFSKGYAKVHLLNEFTGYSFLKPNEADSEKANQACLKVSKWPNPESTMIFDDLGVVCLSEVE